MILVLVLVLYLVSIPFAWLMTKLGHQIAFKSISPNLSDAVIVFIPILNIFAGVFYLVEILKTKYRRKVDASKFFKI
ncbi:hypothetical protein VL08_13160 [Bacillus subtilis]|uniref:hypothetical protein n=1 Tax=Bacillus subtilis TaxID=1423 RepID=UPI00065D943B|nr:hypothetical protein [Bacillus subtilis]KMN94586.1 hypothetical protein VL08_13160 [Bacillus subtilis]MEC2202355.1 hypothetical protein [Bacillus subtilis]OAZ70917.1 hypothetical protein SRCM101280_00743 [Bacillus subtilis]QAW40601.1 hypothetical protein ETL58_03550 [Bacillus subtilis]